MPHKSPWIAKQMLGLGNRSSSAEPRIPLKAYQRRPITERLDRIHRLPADRRKTAKKRGSRGRQQATFANGRRRIRCKADRRWQMGEWLSLHENVERRRELD